MKGCMQERLAIGMWSQEKDDVRKRRRQERLNELRTGTRKNWVQLFRQNPEMA